MLLHHLWPDRLLNLEDNVNEAKQYTAVVGDQPITIETGKLAGQAGGAVTIRMGDSMLLATATMSKHPRDGIDFFPLSVD